jgi:histidine ammonia-lyase
LLPTFRRLLGIGSMHDPSNKGSILPAAEILARHNFTPIKLKAKEGLALINGTQFMASLGAEALVRGTRLAVTADIVTALTLESLLGTKRAYDARVCTLQMTILRMSSAHDRHGETGSMATND